MEPEESSLILCTASRRRFEVQKSKNKWKLSRERSVRTVMQSVTELEIDLEAFNPRQCRIFTLLYLKLGPKLTLLLNNFL